MSVRIIVDSASDITLDRAAALEVDVIPLKTIFGGEEYLDGVTISHKEFYEKLIESDVHPTTSQIPPYEFEERFAEAKEAGDTVLCITLSSKLSGTYQSANIAAEDYEDMVTIVDSENVAIGEHLLVELAVKLRGEGKSAKEIAEVLNVEKKKIKLIALLDTLEYLKKGGRISGTAAAVGGLLSIKPVIAIENGEIAVLGKARGSRNGQNLLREYSSKQGDIDYSKSSFLAYTGLSDELLHKYISDSQELYAGFGKQPPIFTIGSSIGTHAGPGAIAVAFFIA
ncbi:MAG: DegV family protein [Lachnospiraceae bacterium]|nr:DegV family protein [Lachnospiraceae bacterium]